jgi:hypothetical protein
MYYLFHGMQAFVLLPGVVTKIKFWLAIAVSLVSSYTYLVEFEVWFHTEIIRSFTLTLVHNNARLTLSRS